MPSVILKNLNGSLQIVSKDVILDSVCSSTSGVQVCAESVLTNCEDVDYYALSNASFQRDESENFPSAKALADVVKRYIDADISVNTYIPKAMLFSGADDTDGTTGITSSTHLFNGSTNNSNSYNNLLITLQNLRKKIKDDTYFSDISNDKLRIVFTDSVKSVGFDSAKLTHPVSFDVCGNNYGSDISSNAFAKIYEGVKSINDNHVARREFLEAELAVNNLSFITRYSSTLKQLEDRVVFALEYENKIPALLAVSRPPKV
jgi:hypothetical protein